MKYISEEKVPVYLKLKKELALFVGTSQYFESKTFDWIKIEYHPDTIKCTLIHSFDEGNEVFNDVQSFSTVNGLEKETGLESENTFEGTWPECLNWISKNNGTDTGKFIQIEDLNAIYANLVKNGELGNW